MNDREIGTENIVTIWELINTLDDLQGSKTRLLFFQMILHSFDRYRTQVNKLVTYSILLT